VSGDTKRPYKIALSAVRHFQELRANYKALSLDSPIKCDKFKV
jgi:hypothetical protein